MRIARVRRLVRRLVQRIVVRRKIQRFESGRKNWKRLRRRVGSQVIYLVFSREKGPKGLSNHFYFHTIAIFYFVVHS